MKTETQIAQENIKLLLGKRGDREDTTRCKSHKATCQRFLEFFELTRGSWSEESAESFNDKEVDIEQAIKLYNEAGI